LKSLYKNNIDLTKSLKKGDEEAYVYLVKTYHKPLFTYVLSLNNNHVLAEDIVQNVFLKTWEFRKSLNPEYSIKSFLYKTTYNEFINQYHKHRAISTLEKVYLEALNEITDDSNKELLDKKITIITEGITHLPTKCKATFLLSKEEGLTNIEIAEYLNISIKTVEGHLTKAYYLLRERTRNQIKTIFFMLFNTN
jgi:RNA polymerase sigma-70 factor (ECF subfamily)